MTLSKLHTNTTTAKGAINALHNLSTKIKVDINWIEAHVDHKGNELADTAAKAGTDMGDSENIGISMNNIKKQIRATTKKAWINRWKDRTKTNWCKQTKDMFDMLKPKHSKEIRKLSRHDISKVVQFCTGHAHLRKHNQKMNSNLPKTCRLCNQGEETPLHLLTNCEPIWETRRNIFGQPFLDKTRPLAGMDISQLVKFLNWDKISNLFETETQELPHQQEEDSHNDGLQLSEIDETLSSCSDNYMEDSSQE